METISTRLPWERSSRAAERVPSAARAAGGDAAMLLARVTALPHSALAAAIRGLPDAERRHLDELAGEILDEAGPFDRVASHA